jgi:hypothetical protein
LTEEEPKVVRITPQEAEERLRHRVDRRSRYGFDGEQVLVLTTFVNPCSGCYYAGEYGGLESDYEYDTKAGCRVGSGCSECAYNGKRKTNVWVPYVNPKALT